MRYRFLKDDDGHTYLIKAGREKEFYRWIDAAPWAQVVLLIGVE